MKQRGLGTGLGALFGDAAIETASNDFEYVPLQRVEPRDEQPRAVFEQVSIEELAASIREHGVLSPLMVRSMDDGFYQIISGERRWRAAREAGLTELPVRVVVADNKTALELAMVENLQREDLNAIEEARGYRTLMEEFDMTQEEVAQRVSKSRPAVANALRLLSLPSELMEFVLRGELSAGSARALLSIKSSDAMLNAARLAVNNNLSVREVEDLIKKLDKSKKPPPKKTGVAVDYLLDAQNQLTANLGRRVAIKQGRGKGKIEIEYYSQDDFDILFDALSTLVAGKKPEVTIND
ncbi:MAG: ParB/RepB/Spo0J family partition protein [Oscillospiraceae bacterium]|nr:ParB/RepB/Spo0J family partition protein [Oscillospiraceae bacterium]